MKMLAVACLLLPGVALAIPVRPVRPEAERAQDRFIIVTSSGLRYIELVIGDGRIAQSGNAVSVHYVGTFKDGKKFDSSRDRTSTFSCRLGAGQIIKGFDEGITGMRVGGKRTIMIPPELAYGERGAPPTIPPNAELHFEVELLEVAN